MTKFLDLGSTPPADQFLSEHQLSEPEQSYPLAVLLCEECGLVQLSYVVPPEILYCRDYPYESSTTATGGRHWDEFAATTVATFALGGKDLVVDIGSNVGTLLQMFRKHGAAVLGVDPAANIAAMANRQGIETFAAFFNIEIAQKIVAAKGQASVVTAANVFAHVHDLDDFVRALDVLLSDKGIFVIEAPYFPELLRHLEYDTIYHEHLSYLSLKPMLRFFRKHGMEIFDVQQRDIHGGSFRVFVRRQTSVAPSRAIDDMAAAEQRQGIYDLPVLAKFAAAVAQNRADLVGMLQGLKRSGKRIAAVSAPAKGMTLLNYCGIGPDLLDFVTEKSKLKIGRHTPGQRLKVVADEVLLRERPDYALLLAWNFAEEIMANLKAYSAAGGKFIIPIPSPRIVG